MTFLEFNDSSSTCSSNSTSNIKQLDATNDPAKRILSRVPPKIEVVRTSDLLGRVAAFLPQLAASNRKILQERPEDVNIEVLNGAEQEVIEMRLGLGVLEERSSSGRRQSTSESGSENSSSDTEDSDTDTFTDERRSKKILILPSEIKAAATAEETTVDPFEKVIRSLLLFNGSDNEEEEEDEDEDEVMINGEILEFE